MSHTLNDLLDLSQLKEGRIHLELDSIRVQSVASGVVDMLKFMTEGKMITLSMDIPDSFPRVIADEKRLVQILYNLVHNAIKFTYEGTISINAELRDGQAFIHAVSSYAVLVFFLSLPINPNTIVSNGAAKQNTA